MKSFSISKAAIFILCVLFCCSMLRSATQVKASSGGAASASFPAWTYEMKVWPFDVIYPEHRCDPTNPPTTFQDIIDRLNVAQAKGANTVIFYIDDEQMYNSFVDDTGFDQVLTNIEYLIEQAHLRNLKTICYLNGLEVMACGVCKAANGACNCHSSVATLSNTHPEWLQENIFGKTMVWRCIKNDWLEKNMEDAWASPYSGFRDLFKSRLEVLGSKGLDAVYIDQASLPGMQDYGDQWASSDPGFAAAFKDLYGFDVPNKIDWNSVQWRKFIYFRHQAVQDYLQDLADTARASGIVPFFESSANDTSDGTLLANEPALTVLAGIACSPEIDIDVGYPDAFRMAKFTSDIAQAFPMLYLGWPGELATDEANRAAARKELAITLCESGNYYPTADTLYPPNTFSFMDSIRSILNNRVHYQTTGLIYSARNKDWTYADRNDNWPYPDQGRAFNQYATAFTTLAKSHLPFRIIPLETLSSEALQGVGALVIAGVESISDAEFSLLNSHPVVLTGSNGTRDEWFEPRSVPLKFQTVIGFQSLQSGLPFTVQAPASARIEYYGHQSSQRHFTLFVFSPTTGGKVTLSRASPMQATVYELDRAPRSLNGSSIAVGIADYLEVIDLNY
ncbi:MAG TPA: hypothetical protein VEF34_03605 [Syntrophobacteraceae bacterium]|nr:hypothetical protein [Syntrophobacteraceae bacterium]